MSRFVPGMPVPRPAANLLILTGLFLIGANPSAHALLDDLRIIRVDPASDMVRVQNRGAEFMVTVNAPFCHRFTYSSVIPAGTFFAENEAKDFVVTGLNNTSSDLWLYRQSGAFGNGSLRASVRGR